MKSLNAKCRKLPYYLLFLWQLILINPSSCHFSISSRTTVIKPATRQSTLCFISTQQFQNNHRREQILHMSSNIPSDLSSALSKLNKKWEKGSSSITRPGTSSNPSWTKLLLPKTSQQEQDSTSNYNSPTIPQRQDFVYFLEPSTTPSSILLFLGGAVLGEYPHIAYSQFLTSICTKLNIAIIAAPYSMVNTLDHYTLSKQTFKLFTRTIQLLEDNGYNENLPKFMLGHSLGSKLLCIALAATVGGNTSTNDNESNSVGGLDLQGIGFMSFNNFGFGNTIQLIKNIFKGMQSSSASPNAIPMNTVFDFAEQAIGMTGIDFSPNPSDTKRIISKRYNSYLQTKTRFFKFQNDDLDCTNQFLDACSNTSDDNVNNHQNDGNNNINNSRTTTSSSNNKKLYPKVSELSGTHLTPVYINLGWDDLDVPQEAKDFLQSPDFDVVTGGLKSASFGDLNDLNHAVEEVCNWMLGKDPSSSSSSSSLLSSANSVGLLEQGEN